MAIVPNAVLKEDLDYEEILRRGGKNLGDEDFALFKCPSCSRIYLMDYEVDTIYLEAADLSQRADWDSSGPAFTCMGCGAAFPSKGPWLGPLAPPAMQVTWDGLAGSPWRWISSRTRK